ncbi:MAG: LysR family transcriptional regulator [Burkholderiales bacterium]|nr:LysR family transcriptional regulator [Burkholderiales bacterium]MDE1926724.1 LysR family transcriptional regulator [Burkholderiales bacterium]MDE2158634.1 LysR family transcriptional regulator [Burkholderiales bacterium]MDE2504096.1 LysR family transcriptional regulator [Burkholderiales bacterium]
MKTVTFRQLRVFVEVARHLSFVRAAEALHLTPPAVTMQVKELESAIELPLFDREGRKVSLTTAGEYFLVYAKRLLATLKDADDAMARFRKLESGQLTVGMVSTAKYFVPRLLTRFREEHPGVELRLKVGANREELTGWLGLGEVDVAIMGRPPKEMAMRAEPFAAHPHVFVAPPGHPILTIGHPPLAAVATYPLIVREPASGTRALMDRFFQEQRVELRIAMEMPSNETIKQAVMAGMGLSFLSLHTLGLELRCKLIEIVHAEGTPLIRTWNIVHQQSKMLSPAAEALRYFILEHGEAHLAEHDRELLGPATG